ncbi:integrase, catalytic region, zinc finger, CCHC-type containing protein [Tanacetum coccineum]|uniref:Integrase, catalytic region, zinc finger, CCHC-type containing protein n=1 Tax=Tanacetum coccineum TaxID=301880 RepID=A0ABQ5DEG2_9ASTR
MVEEGTSFKKDFKQKENKYLEEFLDMKALKEKVEDKLYKQDQSLQTVHMLCKPKPYYNEQKRTNAGKNPYAFTLQSKLACSIEFTGMHEAHTIVQTRCLELEAELSKLRDKITQLTKKVTVLQEQNELFRAENEKVKQHYKELYDSIKITRAKHIEQTTALLTENENLKCNTMESVKPRVLAPGRYAIDVEPIPPHNRNNREVHLYYLKHLKESVETLREIVEEANVERPLDRSLASACLYTKHSQELLEYVIDTCPKDFNQRDKKHAPTLLIRKKQVTFEEQCDKSNSNNIHKHVEQLNTQKTNVPVAPSTGVNCCTNASGSQPRSNTKKNRISPAKGVNKKKVEECPRTNKSNLRTTNCVDSNSSSKRTVVQIILWYLDSGCSKYMTGDRLRLRNFMKKFIGTVRFGNDHFGAIMGYGDYVIGDNIISRVYYVEGLGHNMFYVGQFCDSDLEVAFRKYSCYVQDTDGVELIKGSRSSNLYTISVEDMMKSSPICLLSKASKKKSWLWHRRLNHLNFGTINDLARKDLTVPRTPEQNDVVKRRNRTLVEAARTMLIFSKALMFLWAEVVATACYTQNRSLVHTLHNKTSYELVHDKKLDLTFFCIFGALCYPINDSKDLGKLQPTADIGIFVDKFRARTKSGSCSTLCTPTNKELEILFQPMFDEYLEPPRVERPVPPGPAVPYLVNSIGVAAESTLVEENQFAPIDNDPFINVFAPEPNFEASSYGDLSSAESPYVTQTLQHLRK